MKRFLIPACAVGLMAMMIHLHERPALAVIDDAETREQEIAIKDLPGPIKQAIKNLKVGQIAEIERETTKSGATTYEIELRVGKQEVELKLDARGKLLGVEIEQDDDDDKGQDDD